MAEAMFHPVLARRGRAALIVAVICVLAMISMGLDPVSAGASQAPSGSEPVRAAGLTPLISGSTPTITGISRVGCTLTAHTGVWDPAPITFAYQWKRNGVAISGATLPTYRAGAADLGATLTVSVAGRRTGSPTLTKSSAATARITLGQFSVNPGPTIYGTARVGGGLGVDAGNWGVAGTSFSVQWNRNGSPIPGANAVFYVPRPLDRGTYLTATVTGSAPGYSPSAVLSALSSQIGYGEFTGSKPTVVGALGVGSVVTASMGTWSPQPDSIRYQWFRDGVPIGGATRSDYQLQNADAGAAITVDTTVSKNGYRSATLPSLYRKDWQWVTLTETYSAWELFNRCINFGDSYDPCDPGWLYVPSDGVRLYSSGGGDLMNVATGIPLRGGAIRWRVTFNDVYKPDSWAFFGYHATGTNAADTTLWNAPFGFPLRKINGENFTTPWSDRVSNGGAVFSIGSLDWSSLFFHTVTIEYETVL
jgi:hypothetical protein